jgi:hypothetical protein
MQKLTSIQQKKKKEKKDREIPGTWGFQWVTRE